MVNKYPFWKYLLLGFALVIGVIYAAPNLYGEDPAVQISHRVNLINDLTKQIFHPKQGLVYLFSSLIPRDLFCLLHK